MLIQKVKYNPTKQKVQIQAEAAKGDEDQERIRYLVDCTDPPRPEFHGALENLLPGVLALLGLPQDYAAGMDVRAVAFSEVGEEEEGAVVSCTKVLEGMSRPFVIHTPLVTIGALEGLGFEEFRCVRQEARAYVDGKRAQGDLFDGQEGADQEEDGESLVALFTPESNALAIM